MIPETIRRKRDGLRSTIEQVRWCDDQRLAEENAPDVAPGGFLNPFGWYVIGTTVGGNAIVVNEIDDGVYFADHTWFGPETIEFKDPEGSGEWQSVPATTENVARALFRLARSTAEITTRGASIDELLDRID